MLSFSIKDHPPRVGTKTGLMNWVRRIHNQVNFELKRPGNASGCCRRHRGSLSMRANRRPTTCCWQKTDHLTDHRQGTGQLHLYIPNAKCFILYSLYIFIFQQRNNKVKQQGHSARKGLNLCLTPLCDKIVILILNQMVYIVLQQVFVTIQLIKFTRIKYAQVELSHSFHSFYI